MPRLYKPSNCRRNKRTGHHTVKTSGCFSSRFPNLGEHRRVVPDQILSYSSQAIRHGPSQCDGMVRIKNSCQISVISLFIACILFLSIQSYNGQMLGHLLDIHCYHIYLSMLYAFFSMKKPLFDEEMSRYQKALDVVKFKVMKRFTRNWKAYSTPLYFIFLSNTSMCFNDSLNVDKATPVS